MKDVVCKHSDFECDARALIENIVKPLRAFRLFESFVELSEYGVDKISDSFGGCHGYHRFNKHTLHKVSVQRKYVSELIVNKSILALPQSWTFSEVGVCLPKGSRELGIF